MYIFDKVSENSVHALLGLQCKKKDPFTLNFGSESLDSLDSVEDQFRVRPVLPASMFHSVRSLMRAHAQLLTPYWDTLDFKALKTRCLQ